MSDRVIRNAHVEDDAWRTLGVDPAEDLANLPTGPIIVPLALAASS